MIHLGDITKISGCYILPVDVVIGGSPCQDLSIAGKRAGLAGARSGLFMEQIRIIKELRYADIQRGRTGQFIRPRFMVWENVPGAFSSNKGEDFRAALEETARIVEPDAVIPRPPKNEWRTSGCIMGDGWSIAWRVLDAQFWGVPQRRRRIALVADFGGHAAPEILFVRKSVCGDIAAGETPGKEAAAGTGSCANSTTGVKCLNPWDSQTQRVYSESGAWCSLSANSGGGQRRDAVLTTVAAIHQNQCGEIRTGSAANTLSTNSNASGRNAPLVFDARGNGDGKTVCTLTGDHPLNCNHEQPIICAGFNPQARATAGTIGYKEELSPTIDTGSPHAVIVRTYQNTGQGWWNESDVGATLRTPCGGDATKANLIVSEEKSNEAVVRRLTPLECERLQGYPDGWTDTGAWTDTAGKLHKESSDSARYKALGNSIALPPWAWVLKRLCACYERTATMASLFDGIGGFPLLWERLNGPGSCLWSSEIEEFPIAVTRRRFSRKED